MNKSESPSVFGRILAGLLGAAAGALVYFGWVAFGPARRIFWPAAWSVTGPIKWFVLGGFVLGALGGWSFAQALWSWAVDDLRSEATSWSTVVLVIIALIAVIAFALKLHAT